MAGLLSWLGNAPNRVANTVNNDVIKPVQRDVVPRVQAAAAQVNPLDSGRTYNTVMQRGATYAPNPFASAIHQATHNGLTNTAGNLTVKPAVATVQAAYNAGQLGAANATGRTSQADAARQQLGQHYNASIPAFFTGNTINGAQAGYNLGFKAPILDLAGKTKQANNARVAGLQEFNRTAPGQLTHPIQYGIANAVHASPQKQIQTGLDPHASAAQKFLGDPVMGAAGTFGLAKTGEGAMVRTKSIADKRVPLNEVGAVGKNVPPDVHANTQKSLSVLQDVASGKKDYQVVGRIPQAAADKAQFGGDIAVSKETLNKVATKHPEITPQRIALALNDHANTSIVRFKQGNQDKLNIIHNSPSGRATVIGTTRVNGHAMVTGIDMPSNKNYLRNFVQNKGAEVIHGAVREGDHNPSLVASQQLPGGSSGDSTSILPQQGSGVKLTSENGLSAQPPLRSKSLPQISPESPMVQSGKTGVLATPLGETLPQTSRATLPTTRTEQLQPQAAESTRSTPLPHTSPLVRDASPTANLSLAEQAARLPRRQNQTPTAQPISAVGIAEPAQIVEQGPTAPSQPFDAKQYITEQTKLQQQAGKRTGGRFNTVRSEVANKMIDALTPIEKPIERILGRSGNTALRNQLDRSLRSHTIAGQYARDNGFHHIVNSVPNTKAFDQYLIAKHAQDLEANGVKTGRNLTADQQLIDQLAPQYEAAAKQLTVYNNGLLDKTVEYGLISPETAAYLKQKYPNYVPFDRIFSDSELAAQRGSGSGPASISTQSVIQKIKGSDRQISSPLENVLAKTHDVIAQGERNNAAKAVVATKDLPGNPLQLKEIKPDETIGTRNTISFLENGTKRVFETTPEVAQAAKSLNQQQLGLIGKILSYPTRALRLGATGLNVGFTAANIAKDVGTAALNSEHPLHASVANPKVFMDALAASFWHGGKNYAELTRQGAGGTSWDIARNNASDTVAKIRSSRNAGTKALYIARHPGELVRAVENTIGRSEEFGRALQYFGNKSAALKQGKDLPSATAYAADAARNNTTNFARAGEYGRVLNSVLPYFNAGLQGSRTLVRNVKNRPVQTVSKLVVGAFIPVAATTAWNLSDPNRKAAYDDIPEYEKQGNIIIIPPHPHKDPVTGRWNVIKIPVSQEVANANNIVRNGVESLHKDKNFDFKAMVADLTGTVTSLNVGSVRQAENQIVPQAAKPVIELSTNTNLYTGNKIVPDSKINLAPQDQYGNNTSGTAKTLGRLTGTSPYQIDNALRTTFAGAGQNALNLSDKMLAKAGVIQPSEVKGTPISAGITNRFYSAAGGSGFTNADNAFAAARKSLSSNPAFQALSQADKAKELNRLKTDITAVETRKYDAKFQTGQFAQNNPTPQKKITKNQLDIMNKGLNLSQYTKTSAQKATNTKVDFNSSPDAQYKAALDSYNKNKGNYNDAQRIKAEANLKKLEVGSKYDKNVRDLYGLSKAQVYDYLTKNPNGAKMSQQLIAYDKALYDAGLVKYKSFANGIAPAKATRTRASSGRTSSGRTSSGTAARAYSTPRVAKAKSYKAPKMPTVASAYKLLKLNKVKATHFKGAKVASFKQPHTRKIAIHNKNSSLGKLLNIA